MEARVSASLGVKLFTGEATEIPVEVFCGNETLFDKPVALGRDSWIVAVPFGRGTRDFVSALWFARKRRAHTSVVLVLGLPRCKRD